MIKTKLYAIILPLLFTFLSNLSRSQDSPPTLSLGLDQVLFGKGIIDVDLLSSIIAEKQGELKSRIVEEQILRPIYDNSPFVTKNYVFHIVKNLMNEKDKNVLKKEVMEYTSNYALVYTLAEMYLQLTWDSIRMSEGNTQPYLNYISKGKLDIQKIRLIGAETSIKSMNSNDFPRLKLTLTDQLELEWETNSNELDCANFNFVLLDMVFHAVRNNTVFIDKGFADKPMYFPIDEYRALSYYQSLKNQDLKRYMYQDIQRFVKDIAQYYQSFDDIIKLLNNEVVAKEDLLLHFNRIDTEQKMILFQEYQESDANYLEKLKQVKMAQDSVLFALESAKSIIIDSIKLPNTSALMDSIIKYKNDLKNWKPIEGKVQNSINSLDAFYSGKPYLEATDTTYKDKLAEAENDLKKAQETFKAALDNLTIRQLQDTLLSKLEQSLRKIEENDTLYTDTLFDRVIQGMYKTFYYIKYNRSEANSLFYITKLRSELIPEIAFINLKSHGKVRDVLKHTEALVASMHQIVHHDFISKVESNTISLQMENILSNKDKMTRIHLEFFRRLDQLDDEETYYYLLENLLMAGDQYQQRDVVNSLNLIIQSIRKYTSFDQATDRIDLDIENIIVALHNKYGYRDKNPFNFYCTIGINNAFAFNDYSLVDGDNNPIRNFGYASEKIGIRVNLFNWKLRSSYTHMETKPYKYKKGSLYRKESQYYKKEPVISNLHFLMYGSGLLYQLTDMSTAKNLNTSFLGAGFGLTFFNNLNFNISLMSPMKPRSNMAWDKTVLNVGFDIYFVEYLSELNKKRKANKEAKTQLDYELQYQERKEQNSFGRMNSPTNTVPKK